MNQRLRTISLEGWKGHGHGDNGLDNEEHNRSPDFGGKKRDHLFCAICQSSLINPQATSCGHFYCHHCINVHCKEQEENFDASSTNCPICKTTLVATSIYEGNSIKPLEDILGRVDLSQQQDRMERMKEREAEMKEMEGLRNLANTFCIPTSEVEEQTRLYNCYSSHMQSALSLTPSLALSQDSLPDPSTTRYPLAGLPDGRDHGHFPEKWPF